MGNFNRGNGGGGGNSRFGGNRGGFGGGRDGGRPDFKKRSFGGDRGGFDKEMFKTVCSECHNACEVPFRPTSGKPVFCKACFATKGGDAPRDRGDRFPRNDFGNKPFVKPDFENRKGERSDLPKKIDEINSKLNRLINAVEVLSLTKSVKDAVLKDIAPVQPKKEVEVKTPAKKVVKKKVLAKKSK